MEINWFPGHMAKTKRLIEEQLPLVDMVIETCDARIPIASRNPDLRKQIAGKDHILVMTKRDLADETKTAASLAVLHAQGQKAVALDLVHSKDLQELSALVREVGAPTVQKALAKGRLVRPLRIMVVGIPNSGKSTLINQLAKRKAAKVEDRPGVTRSRQWIKTEADFELLDMPGVLWPNLGAWDTKLHLAMTGAIKDDILDSIELSYHAANRLVDLYPDLMLARFGKASTYFPEGEEEAMDAEDNPWSDAEEKMLHWSRFEAMARNRACIRKGNKIDEERFAKLLLTEFRSGRIGRMSLEVVI